MRTFNTLSKNECLEYYPLIYSGANKKWKSAIFLSQKNDYASSTFLMISSLEEYLKALILAFDGNGFRFRKLKGVNKIFKNHPLRYPVIYLFHFITSSFEFKESFNKEKGIIRKALFSLIKYFDANSNLKWYANLDKIRENSLYSNINDDGLILASSINKEDFDKNFNNLNKVRRSMHYLLIILNPQNKRYIKERIEFIKTLGIMINELGLYESIDEQLKSIKHVGYKSNYLQTMIEQFHKTSQSSTS